MKYKRGDKLIYRLGSSTTRYESIIESANEAKGSYTIRSLSTNIEEMINENEIEKYFIVKTNPSI